MAHVGLARLLMVITHWNLKSTVNHPQSEENKKPRAGLASLGGQAGLPRALWGALATHSRGHRLRTRRQTGAPPPPFPSAQHPRSSRGLAAFRSAPDGLSGCAGSRDTSQPQFPRLWCGDCSQLL